MKNKKKILFITNAGSKKYLGFGHLFRCINIGLFFKSSYEIYFKTNTLISKKILKKYKFIKKHNSSIQYNYILIDLPNSNKINFKKYFKSKIIIIDEFNNFKNINKFKIFRSSNFKKFYFLKFAFVLNHSNNQNNIQNKNLDYLISFGGSDYYNYSKIIYKYLSKHKNLTFKFLRQFIENKNIPKSKIINNYATIFNKYKVKCFIGSGGNTMFEMISKKIPCLILPTNKIERRYVVKFKNFTNINFLDINKNINSQYMGVKYKKNISINKRKIINEYSKIFR